MNSLVHSAVAVSLLLISANLAPAGVPTESTTHVRSEDYTTTRTEPRRHSPFCFFYRAGRSLFQFPRVFAETIMGDRDLVNRRGVLGAKWVAEEED